MGLSNEKGSGMIARSRQGLVLSTGHLWSMSMAFRLAMKTPGFGFAPGLKNLLRYRFKRAWLWVYERERLILLGVRMGFIWRQENK
jgi:hypothetical protein